VSSHDSGFRPARSGDVAVIVELMRTYYAEDGYPFDPGVSAGLLQRLISEPELGALWAAVTGAGEVIGYLSVTLGFSLEFGGRDAFIDELFIDAGHRGAGLGNAAVALAIDYCRDHGVRALHLEVEPKRRSAARLYEDAGFESHGRILMTRMIRAETENGA